MNNPWIAEIWRVLLILSVSLVLGVWLGALGWMLLLGVLVYLGWHLRNLYILERWLDLGKRFHPPEAAGIWGTVFEEIYRLQQRNRKRKKKLGSMLNRFQQATAAMPDATIVLNRDDEIEWWNTAAANILKLSYPNDIGQRVGNLIRHPSFANYLAAGNFQEPVVFPAAGDSQRELSVRIVAYGNKQRLLVARDVTRLRKLEQMRRDFVANVSHELRTPLTVINGYLETMQDDASELDPQWVSAVSAMAQQSKRMQSIVEDLLMLSRLETEAGAAHEDDVAVPALLAAIEEEARSVSGAQAHDMDMTFDNGLWLRGNESELRSLFSNLIFNAVRYTPAGGKITVRWEEGEDGACFSVEDSGIGIAPHHIPRLTERFYRVDVGRSRDKGGTGLGLAIVKHVLRRHDGTLGIESRLGEGSTFSTKFPSHRILRKDQRNQEELAL